MNDSFCVDRKDSGRIPFHCAVLQPLLGNVVQHPALPFPDHEVSRAINSEQQLVAVRDGLVEVEEGVREFGKPFDLQVQCADDDRSEEHTSELQSPDHLVCRLLLEKKKKKQ